jgi:hypothetical protein
MRDLLDLPDLLSRLIVGFGLGIWNLVLGFWFLIYGFSSEGATCL